MLAGLGRTAAPPPAAGAAVAAAAAAGAAAGAAAHVATFPPAAFPPPAPPAPPAPPLLAPPLARRFPWPRPMVLEKVSWVSAVAGVVVVVAVAVVVVDVVVGSLDWTGFVLLSGLLCDGSGLKTPKSNLKNHNNLGNTYQGENLPEEKEENET